MAASATADRDGAAPRPVTGVPIEVYFFLFTLSGCAGLIYESIWSHYLKLLLGHAAHAQTLVLAIFMGGLALGSWIASRWSMRWRNLLLAYALTEAVIGACALLFHVLFVETLALFQDFVSRADLAPHAIGASKWSLAAALIMPQSVLLGMTFPLMTAGLLRRYPQAPGHALASLYFCNSLGAVAGVLASGLWLTAEIGLPGTITVAGLMNLALAAAVWLLVRNAPEPQAIAVTAAVTRARRYPALLWVAMATGLASFVYELCWIRMLSMVLGAATHSFELMLSAFICGLALGGLWIRKRLDGIGDPVRWLALMQLVMGACALASLAFYSRLFEVMSWLLRALSDSEPAYALYLFGSYGLALLIMLPATFCAGTTLPLITQALLRRRQGEHAIGEVYAANTLGAIAGVGLTVHVGLPWLGLRDTMVAGATIDLVIGVALLAAAPGRAGMRRIALVAILVGVLIALTLGFVQLDSRRMASGVYRYGRASLPPTAAVEFHRDGKTATVNLIRTQDDVLAILTNGKPDAAISMRAGAAPRPDESTMVLAAALPLALRPQARHVANIGLGSGLTTAALLANARLERVDTVEIEAAIIETARGFGPRVASVYSDPRSRIVVEDAKTYFASERRRYDVIVSEPSNPWVSGVASLFTTEFYGSIKRYLADDGVLVQWLQLYEIDLRLVASVINALGQHFSNYVIFQTDEANIVIIAGNGGALETFDGQVFEERALAGELNRIGVRHIDDLRAHRIGDRATLEPLFASYVAPVNSDYHPFVDQTAAKTRFRKRDAKALIELTQAPVPLLEMLDRGRGAPPAVLSPNPLNAQVEARRRASYIHAAILEQAPARAELSGMDELLAPVSVLANTHAQCGGALAARAWHEAAFEVAVRVGPYLRADEAAALWQRLAASACMHSADASARAWLALYAASGRRDGAAMLELARERLAGEAATLDDERLRYAVASAMLGALARGEPAAAADLWREYGAQRWPLHKAQVYLRLLLSTAIYRSAHVSGP